MNNFSSISREKMVSIRKKEYQKRKY